MDNESVDIINKKREELEQNRPKNKFPEMTIVQLKEILELTIKRDDKNKTVTFLAQLSAFTESSQFNVSFNAPSSTGKSYIPLEIASLFPKEDVIKLGNSSRKAFFHEQGVYDKEHNTTVVDLGRKIIIFLDQPHTALLADLRSLLSHDEKELQFKITDKNDKGGNRTKTVILKGFPAVIFASAGLHIDEQEGTRFLLLSPETSQEKLRQAIHAKMMKDSDEAAYRAWLAENPERELLRQRIQAVKLERIDDIKIPNPELIEQVFLEKRPKLKPRHQRDSGRVFSFIKSIALLNVWHRERAGSIITANDSDIQQGLDLWNSLSESQDYNLPPYTFDFYKDVVLSAYYEKNRQNQDSPQGVSKKEIQQAHSKVYGRAIADWYLRQDILPMLETAGLISEEPDKNDKRRVLYYPTLDDEATKRQLEKYKQEEEQTFMKNVGDTLGIAEEEKPEVPPENN